MMPPSSALTDKFVLRINRRVRMTRRKAMIEFKSFRFEVKWERVLPATIVTNHQTNKRNQK